MGSVEYNRTHVTKSLAKETSKRACFYRSFIIRLAQRSHMGDSKAGRGIMTDDRSHNGTRAPLQISLPMPHTLHQFMSFSYRPCRHKASPNNERALTRYTSNSSTSNHVQDAEVAP